MSSTIIKKKNITLIFETGNYIDDSFIGIESNHVHDFKEMGIELDDEDLHKLYNAIGKQLGYPEMKKQNV